jgi:hypothetical protein
MLLTAAMVVVMMAVAPAFASSDDFSVCWNGRTISGLTFSQARNLVNNTSATWGSCNNNNGGGFNNYWPRGAQRAF